MKHLNYQKEERKLLARFPTTARKHVQLNLEKGIDTYERSVVPKSVFTEDG